MTDSNSDLVSADPVVAPEAPAPVVDAASVEPAVEPVADTAVPESRLTPCECPPVDLHADSGYRPVGGAEVKDYLDAKAMGLEGRPSRADVVAFLTAKGARG